MVRVVAGPSDVGLEELRRVQRAIAAEARAAGAAHVVLDPPARAPDASAAVGAPQPTRGERPAAAAERWLAAHPPRSDADMVLDEVLDAVAAAEGAGS